MQKWIIAALAGAAFVAGGFVAGTLGTPDTASAVTDSAATFQTDDTSDLATTTGGPEFHRGRHPGGGHGFLGEVAEDLGVDTEAFREAVAGGATVAEALEAQGIDPADAAEAMVAAGQEKIDEALASGRIDEERAAGMGEHLAERVDTFLESTPADERFAHRHPIAAVGIAQVADILGVEADVVADGLRDGRSIAEIAEANGLERDDLVAQLVDGATERIETWIDTVPGG